MAARPHGPCVEPSRVQPTAAGLLLLALLLPTASQELSRNADVACGQRGVQGKVLGGVDAPDRKWPWQVSVHYAGFHLCGGAVIDEYWILSSAHCFSRDRDIQAFDVYVGLVNLRVAGSHTQWFEVNKVILHPTYERYHPIGGDIALLQLKSRIVFSESVLPVCLAPPDVSLDNLNCWATGWGLISQQGVTSDKLQEVQQPLIPHHVCQVLYGFSSLIMPDMLCAGDLHDVKTVCEGDSGGPLVCEFNGTWMQIGVVSWGRGCAYPMYPAVYARVSYFSEWISVQVAHTPHPPQPLPALSSSTRAAAVSVLVATLAVRSELKV